MKNTDKTTSAQDITETVRSGYAAIASGAQRSCCSGRRSGQADPARLAKSLGYDTNALDRLPEG
ncbi:arsenite S-adenosylmethyltransferase, partial [Desulfovibrio sp. 1214_IL3152]